MHGVLRLKVSNLRGSLHTISKTIKLSGILALKEQGTLNKLFEKEGF